MRTPEHLEYEPGDVVVLNSGGPRMSVCGVAGRPPEQVVLCAWFDGGQLAQEVLLPAAALRIPKASECEQ